MIKNKNQLGRELLPRLVDETNIDMQVAMRFYYNSDFYALLPEEGIDTDSDKLYAQLKQEFDCA